MIRPLHRTYPRREVLILLLVTSSASLGCEAESGHVGQNAQEQTALSDAEAPKQPQEDAATASEPPTGTTRALASSPASDTVSTATQGAPSEAADMVPQLPEPPAMAASQEYPRRVTIDDWPVEEKLLTGPLCANMPKAISETQPRRTVVSHDGYVFINAGYTHELLDHEDSHLQRCNANARELTNYVDMDHPRLLRAAFTVGAYAQDGALYGVHGGRAAKLVNGELAWSDDYDGFLEYYPPGGHNSPLALVLHTGQREAPLYALARAGQLPGHPQEQLNRPVLAKYTADGIRLWTKRVHPFFFWPEPNSHERFIHYDYRSQVTITPTGDLCSAVAVDRATRTQLEEPPAFPTVYLTVRCLTPEGEERWVRHVPLGPNDMVFSYDQVLAFEASAKALFVLIKGEVDSDLASVHPYEPRSVPGTLQLLRLSLSGSIEFNTIFTVRHTSPIASAGQQQIEWHGVQNIAGFWRLAPRANDQVCVGGEYVNWYLGDSIKREPHQDTLLACFGADGSFVWARQFRSTYADDLGSPFEMKASLLGGLAEQEDGSFLASIDVEGGYGTTVVRLEAEQ